MPDALVIVFGLVGCVAWLQAHLDRLAARDERVAVERARQQALELLALHDDRQREFDRLMREAGIDRACRPRPAASSPVRAGHALNAGRSSGAQGERT